MDSTEKVITREYLSQVNHPVPVELLEPFDYVWEKKGKGIRSTLMTAFNLWLQIPKEKLVEVDHVISMLHNASLMVDDIEDNSKLRRGVPVSASIYGPPSVINTANYIYFVSMEKAMNVGGETALKIVLEEFLNLHRGQGWDIYWRDNYICPTEEQYKAMVLDKTGGLFRLALKLMQTLSENKQDYTILVNLLSLFYQIRDDLINLTSESYAHNKSFAEDLSEGKYSFIIIHAISQRRDHQLQNILRQRTTDIDLKKHAISLMKEGGSFDYAQKVLDQLKIEILAEIEKLGGNSVLLGMIEYLEKNQI